jgi:hypothetical protein
MEKVLTFVIGLPLFVFGFTLGSAYEKTQKATAWADTLSHVVKGDVVLSSGSVCVISADPTLDELTFMSYLTSCRRAWDARRVK